MTRRSIAQPATVLLILLMLAGIGGSISGDTRTLAATPAASNPATSLEDSKRIVRDVYAVFSGADPDGVVEIIAPSWTNHAPAFAWLPTGPEGFEQLVGFFRTAFPDLAITVEDLVAEGDLVAARYTIRGTHLGPLGDTPATGKPIEIQAMDLFRIVDGRVTDVWPVVDQLALLSQIGVLPGAAADEATPAT